MNICSFLSLLFHSHISSLAMVTLITLACNIPVFCSEIHDAAVAGDLAKVKTLLKENPELISSEDNHGWTPLHCAVKNGRIDIVELLLANKANVHARYKDLVTPFGVIRGYAPLHIAASNGHKDIAELLLTHGADINAKDKDGRTPLHLAAQNGRKEAAALLLSKGADANAMANNGFTAFHYAAGNGHKDIVELLPQNTPTARDDSHVLMNAIDLERYRPLEEYVSNMAHKLGIPVLIINKSPESRPLSPPKEASASKQDFLNLFIDGLHDYSAMLVKKDRIFQVISRSNDIREGWEAVTHLDQVDALPKSSQATGPQLMWNFEGIRIQELVDITTTEVGLIPVEIDPEVHGRAFIFCRSSISREEALQILITVLKNNNAVLIGSGMGYRVIPASKAIPAGWELVTRLPISGAPLIPKK
jgi:hypothetical protein